MAHQLLERLRARPIIGGLGRSLSWARSRNIPAPGEIEVRRVPTTADPLPPILINTMPKSGSIYLARMVATSLDVHFSLKTLTSGLFPTYVLLPDPLKDFVRGHIVRQEHFDATPENLATCRSYVDRIVLHVRDPRQATLSWAHHVNRLRALDQPGPKYSIHEPPSDFDRWTFGQQLGWHVEFHLASLVAWLRQWMALGATPSAPTILWTTYDDLIRDERALFDRIMDFYGIRAGSVDLRPPPKTIAYNFRSGQPDEWQTVMTAGQKARCTALIGRDVLDRFGWH